MQQFQKRNLIRSGRFQHAGYNKYQNVEQSNVRKLRAAAARIAAEQEDDMDAQPCVRGVSIAQTAVTGAQAGVIDAAATALAPKKRRKPRGKTAQLRAAAAITRARCEADECFDGASVSGAAAGTVAVEAACEPSAQSQRGLRACAVRALAVLQDVAGSDKAGGSEYEAGAVGEASYDSESEAS